VGLKQAVNGALNRAIGAWLDDYFVIHFDDRRPCYELSARADFGVYEDREIRPGVAEAAVADAANGLKRLAFDHVFPPGTELFAVLVERELTAPAPPAPYERMEEVSYDWLGPNGRSIVTYTRLVAGAPGVDEWLAARDVDGYFLEPGRGTLLECRWLGLRVYSRQPEVGADMQRRLAPALAAARARLQGPAGAPG